MNYYLELIGQTMQDIDKVTGMHMIGTVSLAGCDNSWYKIVGGNYQLLVKVLESSTAEIRSALR